MPTTRPIATLAQAAESMARHRLDQGEDPEETETQCWRYLRAAGVPDDQALRLATDAIMRAQAALYGAGGAFSECSLLPDP